MKTPLDSILILGNPKLYEVSAEIKREECSELNIVVQTLHEILMAFREKYKRGRAIAAPQIGVMKRLIYMNIDRPVVFINPKLTWKNPELIELWDDCMSFPDVLVKVMRHKSCKIKFRDLAWNEHEWELDGDLSELLQHEYDHLDGILAVMRAADKKSFALYTQKHYISFTR